MAVTAATVGGAAQRRHEQSLRQWWVVADGGGGVEADTGDGVTFHEYTYSALISALNKGE
jgi:hypothetical protein